MRKNYRRSRSAGRWSGRSVEWRMCSPSRSLAPSFIGEIDDIAAARKLKANNLKWPSLARPPPSTGWAEAMVVARVIASWLLTILVGIFPVCNKIREHLVHHVSRSHLSSTLDRTCPKSLLRLRRAAVGPSFRTTRKRLSNSTPMSQ